MDYHRSRTAHTNEITDEQTEQTIMSNDEIRGLVIVDDGILEVQKTGLVVVCDKTNAELHVLHFRNESSGLAGMAIGRDLADAGTAYQEGRYTAVHPEFEPSSLQRDRYARAQMSGRQGLGISAEIKGDYTLVGVYLQGLEAAIEDSNSDLRDLVRSGRMTTPEGRQEAQELAQECDRLEHLKEDARAIRDGLSEMSKSYHLGYRMEDPTPAILANPDMVDSYALGLTVRTGELKDAEGTHWHNTANEENLKRAEYLYSFVHANASDQSALNTQAQAEKQQQQQAASPSPSPGM